MKRFKLVLLFFLILSASVMARDARRVAMMVHRPSNRLAWSSVSDEAAFMLGMDKIIRDFTGPAPEINHVGAFRINGIVQGMESGLYFPEGDTVYGKWEPFLEADVFVDAEFGKSKLQWRAGNSDGEEFESEVIRNPYDNPMLSAAELVRVIFRAVDADIPEQELSELETMDPDPPGLFMEWAKWIGYRPHWLHHAPWEGPQKSAKKILENDPEFFRGVAWALSTMMRVPKDRDESPASLFLLPQALGLLNSPHAEEAFKFIRKYADNEEALQPIIGLFGLEDLAFESMLEFDAADEEGDMEGFDPEAVDIEEMEDILEGPRFRKNLVRALAPMERQAVEDALVSLVDNDDAAEVRAVAAQKLAENYPDQKEAVRETFEMDPEGPARAGAFEGLIHLGTVKQEDIEKAADDESAAVRLAVAESLPDCDVDPDVREAVWLQLIDDENPDVRATCLAQLRRHAEVSATQEKLEAALEAALEEDDVNATVQALRWVREERAEDFEDLVSPLLNADESRVRAAAARTLAVLTPDKATDIIEDLAADPSARVQKVLSRMIADAEPPDSEELIFNLLERSRPDARDDITENAYRVIGSNRPALARAMLFDPKMMVNLGAFRLAGRVMGEEEFHEFLANCYEQSSNEYIQARALREMAESGAPRTREFSIDAVQSPYWTLMLEGADVLADGLAEEPDADAIREGLDKDVDQWLELALEDALAVAEDRPEPEKVRLGLGETEHTPGGNNPRGFQTWLGRMPGEEHKRRELVEEGFRFGTKTDPPNM
ncbi:MAG: hypothetical protein ACOCSQ_06125, partial [Planctomycetota bacterium]